MSDKRAKRLAEKVEKTRIAAHQRVVKDAMIQFRLDQESMERLLKVADEERTGVGVVCRNWVLDRLQNKESRLASAVTDLTHILQGGDDLQKQIAGLKREVDMLKKSIKLSKAV
jgi:hypothetical protein